MQADKILQSIIRHSKELTKIALTSRLGADEGSIQVTSAVMLLIATIYFINKRKTGLSARALIDTLVDQLPRYMEDRSVDITHAVMETELIEAVKSELMGARRTNMLGAFTAIYNSRVARDIIRMTMLEDGPMGELGGMAAVIGEAITTPNKTPDMIAILGILGKHVSNITPASAQSGRTNLDAKANSGSKACFVATACFGSPEAPTVITLRKYREAVLKRTPSGRYLIRFYYKVSPPIARFLERHDQLRKYVGLALTWIAPRLQKTHEHH
jgi:hypothetical protein